MRKRYLIVFLIFWGYFNIFANSVNMSVAIVAMTEETPVETPGTSTNPEAPSEKRMMQEFGWSASDKGIILGSYFYGYVTTQALGGILATKYGGFMVSFKGKK